MNVLLLYGNTGNNTIQDMLQYNFYSLTHFLDTDGLHQSVNIASLACYSANPLTSHPNSRRPGVSDRG